MLTSCITIFLLEVLTCVFVPACGAVFSRPVLTGVLKSIFRPWGTSDCSEAPPKVLVLSRGWPPHIYYSFWWYYMSPSADLGIIELLILNHQLVGLSCSCAVYMVRNDISNVSKAPSAVMSSENPIDWLYDDIWLTWVVVVTSLWSQVVILGQVDISLVLRLHSNVFSRTNQSWPLIWIIIFVVIMFSWYASSNILPTIRCCQRHGGIASEAWSHV